MSTLICVWNNETAQGTGYDDSLMSRERHQGGKHAHIQMHKHTCTHKGRNARKCLKRCTSILRPSTTVPCNFSLALSASTLCSNVTNPKPCKAG